MDKNDILDVARINRIKYIIFCIAFALLFVAGFFGFSLLFF
jgi:hypothetical protein